MKRTLKEDLERIHGLTYGNKVLNESFIDNILNKVGLSSKDTKKVDDPKKADLVSSDVQEFFDNIKKAADGGGLSQQGQGSMTYQKEVESMQIGLMMLGYELPKHGVDGLFGPETGAAVQKFTDEKLSGSDKKPLNENVTIVPNGSGLIGNPGQGTHNVSKDDPFSGNAWDIPGKGEVISATDGKVIHNRKDNGFIQSGVKKIYGDQLLIQNNDGSKIFYTHIDSPLKSGDVVSKGDHIGTIKTSSGIPSHVHVGLEWGKNLSDIATVNGATPGSGISGPGGKSSGGSSGGGVSGIKATPEMLTKLLELLKQKGVTSEDLKKYIDSITTGGGVLFTDLDLKTEEGRKAYAEISQKFIDTRKPNLLGITGDMMMKGAVKALKETKKYIPPELALAQLAAEGGIGNNNPNSRPIKYKNPFNVGNTDDPNDNIPHGDVQSGINAYYNLIGTNYLGKGKTANDLVQNFVNKDGNRYATAGKYEALLSSIVPQVNRIAQPIYAKLNKTTDSNLA